MSIEIVKMTQLKHATFALVARILVNGYCNDQHIHAPSAECYDDARAAADYCIE